MYRAFEANDYNPYDFIGLSNVMIGILTARHGTSRHGTARHGTARHGSHDTARHGTARHGTARHDTARHGTVLFKGVLALAVVRFVIAHACGLCSGLSILICQACMITSCMNLWGFQSWWAESLWIYRAFNDNDRNPYEFIGLSKMMSRIPMHL